MRILEVGTVTIRDQAVTIDGFRVVGACATAEQFGRHVLRRTIWVLIKQYLGTYRDGGGNTGVQFREAK